MNVATRRGQADAAANGIDLLRAADILQVYAAAARRNFYFPIALVDFYAAAPSLNGCTLGAGLNHDAAAARLGDNFAVGVPNFNRASTCVQAEIAAHRSHIDRSASGFSADA